MWRDLQNIVVVLFALLIVVFSSGVNLYQHHCFVENSTEIVFDEDDIECSHHNVCSNSCCNCSHQHGCSEADNRTSEDSSSFNQEACAMNNIFLVVDKYCIFDYSCSFDADVVSWCDVNPFIDEKLVVLSREGVQSWLKFNELVRCPLYSFFSNLISLFYIHKIIQSS